MQGASIFHLARGLHRRDFFTTREILGAIYKQAYFRVVGVEDPEHVAEARHSALAFIAGHTVTELEELGRGDLRRGDGAPDLAGHPGPGPAAPRPGPAGLAGHRRADRDRPDHRPPARPDRGDGHGRRARRRRLHRPAGRRHAARTRQGRGDQGARGPRAARPGPLHGVLRLLQRPADAAPGRRGRARSTPTPGCAPTPAPPAGRSATTAPAARRPGSASPWAPPRARSPAPWPRASRSRRGTGAARRAARTGRHGSGTCAGPLPTWSGSHGRAERFPTAVTPALLSDRLRGKPTGRVSTPCRGTRTRSREGSTPCGRPSPSCSSPGSRLPPARRCCSREAAHGSGPAPPRVPAARPAGSGRAPGARVRRRRAGRLLGGVRGRPHPPDRAGRAGPRRRRRGVRAALRPLPAVGLPVPVLPDPVAAAGRGPHLRDLLPGAAEHEPASAGRARTSGPG